MEDDTSRSGESAIEPELPIVDAHHHLMDGSTHRYRMADFSVDACSGHQIEASVFVECRTMYRKEGPPHLRPAGEAEFMAAEAASSGGRYCQGFVGYADLRGGERLGKAIAALASASGGRLRSIRQPLRWSEEAMPGLPHRLNPPWLMQDPDFRAGFATLADYGLTFDAFLIHWQLGDLAELARRYPEVTIVLNHVGGPVGFGDHGRDRVALLADWAQRMASLSACGNVAVKLGGMGMPFMGILADMAGNSSSEKLAAAFAPYVHRCIDLFGPERCLFESNFPVDRAAVPYSTLWNAFKILSARYTAEERRALLSGTARRLYRLT